MKTLKLLIIASMLLLSTGLKSQVSVNVNIGSPPLWGPVGFADIQYYYLPDIEVYYDVPTAMFLYYEGGMWVRRGYLPRRYRNYNLYNGYKVVLNDYRGNEPYVHFKDHKGKYAKGYRAGPQKTIGENPRKANNKNVGKAQQGNENKGGGGKVKDSGGAKQNGNHSKGNKGGGGKGKQ
jgi:hypothetical protein